MPEISVLMPVYKTKLDYLKEAITSVLNQTFSDFEFLILDDCPEDNREEIIHTFHDDRIKYIKNQKNIGISESRNKLIQIAKGNYLAVIDHDDVALPTRFEEQVQILNQNSQMGAVGCWLERFPNTKIIKYPEHNAEIEEYLMQGCALPHTGTMIRKSVVTGIQYQSEFFPSEDYHLWCQLIGKTKFYNVPKVLMKYRWHSENTSKKQSNRMAKATQKIQNIVRTQHKDIWGNVCNNAPHIVRVKIFGLIPLRKFHQKGKYYKGWLRFIPLISIKTKLEVNQK